MSTPLSQHPHCSVFGGCCDLSFRPISDLQGLTLFASELVFSNLLTNRLSVIFVSEKCRPYSVWHLRNVNVIDSSFRLYVYIAFQHREVQTLYLSLDNTLALACLQQKERCIYTSIYLLFYISKTVSVWFLVHVRACICPIQIHITTLIFHGMLKPHPGWA